MALLEVKSLSISFGGLEAVGNFQISIEKGQLYGLIGPSGAGKTTIFNLLTSVYKLDTRNIELAGVNITGRETTEINQAGIARTFQNIRLLKDLSVLDNVKAGFRSHYRYSITAGIFRLPSYSKVEKQIGEGAMELLKVFGLDGECDYKASNLPYGKQRELEITRALATEPRLPLLDEPAAGISPNGTAELMDIVRFARDNFDMTVLPIEYDMRLASGICEELTVLNPGQVLCQGEAGAVLHNPEVVRACLGK